MVKNVGIEINNMSNKEKKKDRGRVPHDYESLEWFRCKINGNSRVFHVGDIIWESEYDQLSAGQKKKCKSLPPKDVLIKEKVKKEKKENKVKIESKGFDYIISKI